MLLKIFLDFKSPAAYLAIKPTVALIEEYHPEVQWLAVRSTQKKQPKPAANAGKGSIHRYVRGLARMQTHLLYAGIQGIEMKFPDSDSCTDLALAALGYTAKSDLGSLPFIHAAFSAHWSQQADLNDLEVVLGILSDRGYRPKESDLKAALEELPDAERVAHEAGVFEAPSYLIADQMFLGREHLPWIKLILASG